MSKCWSSSLNACFEKSPDDSPDDVIRMVVEWGILHTFIYTTMTGDIAVVKDDAGGKPETANIENASLWDSSTDRWWNNAPQVY